MRSIKHSRLFAQQCSLFLGERNRHAVYPGVALGIGATVSVNKCSNKVGFSVACNSVPRLMRDSMQARSA
jgi:hypothetical protein